MGEQYRYDQLNRLKSSDFYRVPLGGGTPAATQDYATSYLYDANGNLLTLQRNGNASVGGQPLAMDQLSYSYDTGNNRDNRLLRVTDSAPDAYADDVKFTQGTADQYVYDALGNLLQDNDPAGGVTKTITWNVYGKISQVTQSNGILVQYGYDAQGNRIHKRFSSNNGTNWRHVYYVRDATGNVLAVYEQTEAPNPRPRFGQPATVLSAITLTEQPLYGGSRLGERKLSLALTTGTPASDAYQRVLQKQYELTDHLGNVRALVSDAKVVDVAVAGTYKPDLVAYYNYYPFGMLQPNRNGPGTKSLTGGYRYGFNGKEMDNNSELGLTTYDYGFRIYNPGLGRFLSVDPLEYKNVHESPYSALDNNPINILDPDGQNGIKVIDVEHKTITITAVYYVQIQPRLVVDDHGKTLQNIPGYTEKDVIAIKKTVNDYLNNLKINGKEISVSEGKYAGYTVKFDLDFRPGGTVDQCEESAKKEMLNGYEIGNSFGRGDETIYPKFKIISVPAKDENGQEIPGKTVSRADGGVTTGYQSILMNRRGSYDNRINKIHELFHTFGFDDYPVSGKGIMLYPPQLPNQQDINQLINSTFLPETEAPKVKSK